MTVDDVAAVAALHVTTFNETHTRNNDGPPYALVCAERPEQGGLRLFHTNDRETVEALAFRLQRELRMPTLA